MNLVLDDVKEIMRGKSCRPRTLLFALLTSFPT